MGQGLALSGGEENTYKEMLYFYCLDVEFRLEFLNYEYAESELNDFITHVHALKSASASIGAGAVSEEARALESAGKRNDMAFIREQINVFREHLADLAVRIDEALSEKMENEIRAAEVLPLLQQLKEALLAKETIETERILSKLKAKPIEASLRKTVSVISFLVMEMEFTDAAHKLDRLLNEM